MDPATIALVRLGVLVGMSGWGIIKDIIAECKTAGLELEDLSVLLHSQNRSPRRQSQLRLLPDPPAGSGGADRRAVPDHGDDGEVLQ